MKDVSTLEWVGPIGLRVGRADPIFTFKKKKKRSLKKCQIFKENELNQ